MAINFPYTHSPTTTIASSEVNANNESWRTAVRGAHHRDADGTPISNADIAAGAGIVYSKLSLAGSIVNNDINGAAGIAYSKLSLAGSIVNSDISVSAALAEGKIAWDGTNGHDHSGGSNSRKLDWDNCWSDAAHDHSSAAEGGSSLSPASVTASGQVSAQTVRANGNSGNGYVEFREQSSRPATPSSSLVRVYFDGFGNIGFVKDDGTKALINLSTGAISVYS